MSDAADPSPPRERWSRRYFVSLLGIAVVLHLTLVLVFGTKDPVRTQARPASVPQLRLTEEGNEYIALTDPTLLARPNPHDLVSAFWRHSQPISEPNFNWTEPPQYLPLDSTSLGAAFHDFMRVREPAALPVNFKPEPVLTLPAAPVAAALQATTMEITGELAHRRLLTTNAPPPLAANDVVPPSRVQVLVEASGSVASAVLLPMEDGEDAQKDPSRGRGDAKALAWAQGLRFVPGPQATFGEIVFRWHSVPGTSTNTP
ncbi:MAG TPA: hypothetical protein VF988_13875 [Verrucomicrobiae bacterium]